MNTCGDEDNWNMKFVSRSFLSLTESRCFWKLHQISYLISTVNEIVFYHEKLFPLVIVFLAKTEHIGICYFVNWSFVAELPLTNISCIFCTRSSSIVTKNYSELREG